MINDNFIYGSSGFILPANSYYEAFEPENSYVSTIFNRSTIVSNKEQMIEFYGKKDVYRSNIINNALKEYIANESFENYMALYTIALDIFKAVDMQSFFRLQAGNVHLSPISNKFCNDIVTSRFKETYMDYAITPFNLRWTVNSRITKTEIEAKVHQVEKELSKNYLKWESVLPDLGDDRMVFMVFFKYIFADFY